MEGDLENAPGYQIRYRWNHEFISLLCRPIKNPWWEHWWCACRPHKQPQWDRGCGMQCRPLKQPWFSLPSGHGKNMGNWVKFQPWASPIQSLWPWGRSQNQILMTLFNNQLSIYMALGGSQNEISISMALGQEEFPILPWIWCCCLCWHAFVTDPLEV